MAWAWGKSGARGEALRGRGGSADSMPGTENRPMAAVPVPDAAVSPGGRVVNIIANSVHARAPALKQEAPDDSAVGAVPPSGAPAQQPLAPLSPEAMQRSVAMRRMAASFGDIVGLMMRSPQYKALSLADLEWIVIPALRTGQCMVMEQTNRATGAVRPLAAVLWAGVSEEVELRLRAETSAGQIAHVAPQEWTSGARLWIVAGVGDQTAVSRLAGEVRKTVALKTEQSPQLAAGSVSSAN